LSERGGKPGRIETLSAASSKTKIYDRISAHLRDLRDFFLGRVGCIPNS